MPRAPGWLRRPGLNNRWAAHRLAVDFLRQLLNTSGRFGFGFRRRKLTVPRRSLGRRPNGPLQVLELVLQERPWLAVRIVSCLRRLRDGDGSHVC